MSEKTLYKVVFVNHGKVFEIYAQYVDQADIFGFIEVVGLVFGENSSIVVDPSEEKLKDEFKDVERTLIPQQAVIRIDQVTRQGVSKIHAGDSNASNVTAFPTVDRRPD